MNTKKVLIYLIFALIIFSGYFCYKNEVFPAAIVNWNIITQKSLNNYYEISVAYLNKTIYIYGADTKPLEDKDTKKQIKAALLDKLIEDVLIYKEVKHRAGDELEAIANQKIENVLKDSNIEEAINTLFESTLKDYIQKELKPQAYKEILEGRMLLNNESFEEWLKLEKQKANVLILLPGYFWDGEGVKTPLN